MQLGNLDRFADDSILPIDTTTSTDTSTTISNTLQFVPDTGLVLGISLGALAVVLIGVALGIFSKSVLEKRLFKLE